MSKPFKIEHYKIKRCIKCGKMMPLTEFYKDKNRSDGLQYYCKKCCSIMGKSYRERNVDMLKQRGHDYNQKHKEQCAKRTALWRKRHSTEIYLKQKHIIHDLKINGCAICGYDKCDAALEFHHVNQEDKKFCLTARNVGYSEILVAEELNKCILLCSNCHREIHNGDK